MAKQKFDPTWRLETLFEGDPENINPGGSLETYINRLQSIKDGALEKNLSFRNFQIRHIFDEYSMDIAITAERPETEEEKLWRTNKHPSQLEAKKRATVDFEVSAKTEVRRLCKQLKVNSPV